MGTDAHAGAAVEHDDEVGVAHRAHALSDDELGRAGALAGEGLTQLAVGREVEGAERVVEDKDLGPAGDGAAHGQALALAARDVPPALLDGGVKAALHALDEVGRLGHRERGAHVVARDLVVRLAVGDVARDGALEERGRLRDVADAAVELLERVAAHVAAVDEDLALRGVEEAVDELDEGRLA